MFKMGRAPTSNHPTNRTSARARLSQGNENPPPLFLLKQNNTFQRRTAVADQVGLQRIGFALSGLVAIVVAVAALTVSASMGAL